MTSVMRFLGAAIVCAHMAVTAVADASSDQYDFLTELYESTSGEMWVNNTNWLVHDDDKGISLCDWHGISCAGKWVESIDLKKNGLGGPLPDRWERVPYVDSLDLSDNKILGTLPPSLGNLTLERLILSGNAFKGTIPSALGGDGGKSLTLLYLDNNAFTGSLPSELAAHPLRGLTLDLNHLTGEIPAGYGDLGPQLMVVSASYNDFTGTLPVGLCAANSCSFQYNEHLGCPSQDQCHKCMLPLCNCGLTCSSTADCAGGSCGSCSTGPWGYKTCGGQ